MWPWVRRDHPRRQRQHLFRFQTKRLFPPLPPRASPTNAGRKFRSSGRRAFFGGENIRGKTKNRSDCGFFAKNFTKENANIVDGHKKLMMGINYLNSAQKEHGRIGRPHFGGNRSEGKTKRTLSSRKTIGKWCNPHFFSIYFWDA